MSKYFKGYRADLGDPRDHRYAKRTALTQLRSVNLQDFHRLPEPVDQGQLGSCTANAIGAAINYSFLNKHIQYEDASLEIPVSRLFIYYNERLLEGTIDYDSGAEIRDGIKSVAKQGVCSESLWPYDISRFTQKPSPYAYTKAQSLKALQYERLDNSSKLQMVDCLASGHPIIIGATLFESFESLEVASTGDVPMPDFSRESQLGGHAFLIYRYRLSTDRYYCLNSWGPDWGNKGRFSIPAEYLSNLDLATDAWTIKLIS